MTQHDTPRAFDITCLREVDVMEFWLHCTVRYIGKARPELFGSHRGTDLPILWPSTTRHQPKLQDQEHRTCVSHGVPVYLSVNTLFCDRGTYVHERLALGCSRMRNEWELNPGPPESQV